MDNFPYISTFYGKPVSYWLELDARAKEAGRDKLIIELMEARDALASYKEINEHLLKACLALLEEDKKGWK